MAKQLINLTKIVEKYLNFVYKWNIREDKEGNEQHSWEIKKEDLEEYFEEDFKFFAVNNWECGFDIVQWYEGTGDYALDGHYKCGRKGDIKDLLDFQSTCLAIRYIQTYYSDNFGDDNLMNWENFTPELIIQHFAYVYLHSMDFEKFKKLFVENFWDWYDEYNNTNDETNEEVYNNGDNF